MSINVYNRYLYSILLNFFVKVKKGIINFKCKGHHIVFVKYFVSLMHLEIQFKMQFELLPNECRFSLFHETECSQNVHIPFIYHLFSFGCHALLCIVVSCISNLSSDNSHACLKCHFELNSKKLN